MEATKTILFSISKLEDFRLFLTGAPFMPEAFGDLVRDRWLKKTPQNQEMKFGNAFHDWVERGGPEGDHIYINNPKTDDDGNVIPGTGEEILLPSVELRNVRDWVRQTHPYRDPEVEVPSWEIQVGEYRFLITGRIDGDLGIGVEDHKLKQRKPPSHIFDNYSEAIPWEFYLAMTGKKVFFYNIFYRRSNCEDWVKGPDGRSMLVTTPQIELVETIKLFTYPGIEERCRLFAWELFSLLVKTGFAEKLYAKQARWPEKYRKTPSKIIRVEAPENFGLADSDLRAAEAYILAGKISDKPVKNLAIGPDGKILLPVTNPSDHSLLFGDMVTRFDAPSQKIDGANGYRIDGYKQGSGIDFRKILDNNVDKMREKIAQAEGPINFIRLDEAIAGKIGTFYPGEDEPEKVLVEGVVAVAGTENEYRINFANDKPEFYSELPLFYTVAQDVYIIEFAGSPPSRLRVDSTYKPDSILDDQADDILAEPPVEEETDLKIVKAELLKYKDRPDLISIDGGIFGTLRKVNKKGDRIRIEIETAGVMGVEFVVSMLKDGDFRTSGNRVINTLPF